MSKQEEIIEVCGKKVVVRYARTPEEACASCVLCSRKECNDFDCNIRDITRESVCRYSYFVEMEQPQEETHSLRGWAQILATNPDLRAEFDKMCPPQPIQGSIAPEEDLEVEIRRINISPSEVRYVIDAIPSYAGIFMTEDDAKKGLAIFKAGAQNERERLMKEAVECNVIWYDGRLLDFTQQQLDAALDKVGAGVDAKVSVIIIKKEK